jgi:hypothetical protein
MRTSEELRRVLQEQRAKGAEFRARWERIQREWEASMAKLITLKPRTGTLGSKIATITLRSWRNGKQTSTQRGTGTSGSTPESDT